MRRFVVILSLIAATSSSTHAQWQVSQLAPVTEYRSVHAASDAVLWAGGRAGIIARSADGRTWTADSVPGAAGLFFSGIWAADPDTAAALGTGFESSAAAVYRTTDGGASWTRTYYDERAGIFLDALGLWEKRPACAMVSQRFRMRHRTCTWRWALQDPGSRMTPAQRGKDRHGALEHGGVHVRRQGLGAGNGRAHRRWRYRR